MIRKFGDLGFKKVSPKVEVPVMSVMTKVRDKTILKRGERKEKREPIPKGRTRHPRISPKPSQITTTKRKINKGKKVTYYLKKIPFQGSDERKTR